MSTNTLVVLFAFSAIVQQSASAGLQSERQKTSVRPLAGNVRSYSGFVKVNEAYNSQLFYWLFECEETPSEKPVLVWLHGDLGKSSIVSVFEEHGPYKLVGEDKVIEGETSFTRDYNVLYIDSVVGVGYSSTKKEAGYSKTVQQAAENLYKALTEILRIHQLEKYKLFLVGESFAAKFVLALGAYIHKETVALKTKMNLKGVSVGAGFIDPVNQQVRAEFLYQMGVIDPEGKYLVQLKERDAQTAISQRNYDDLKKHRGDVDEKIKNAGFDPAIDVMEPNFDLSLYKKIHKFLKSKKVRQEIHVGKAKFEENPKKVLKHFENDMLTSSSYELDLMLKHYNVVMYTGQYDLKVPTSQMDVILHQSKWEDARKFHSMERAPWVVYGQFAGYSKSYGTLYQFMVRKANHYVARSRPSWVLGAFTVVFQ